MILKGGNILGDDSRNYWLRVADLRPYLYKIFKEPDIAVTLPTLSSLDPYIPSELDERLKFVQDNIRPLAKVVISSLFGLPVQRLS